MGRGRGREERDGKMPGVARQKGDERTRFDAIRSSCTGVPLVVLAATGCTVGPEYSPPDLSSRTEPAWRADNAATPTGLSLDHDEAWWGAFEDPELSRLISELAASNLELVSARQRIVEARARRGIENAERLPQLDVSGQYQRIGSGDDALPFAAPPPGEETDFISAGAMVGWEIDLWGRVSRLVEAADAEIDAATFDHRAAFVSLSAEVAQTYTELRSIGRRLEVLDRNIRLQQRTLDLARSELRSGTGTEFDVAQAARTLEQTRAERPELRQAQAAAENAIAVLLGQRPRDGLVAPGDLPEPPEVIGIGLSSQLLTRRADLRAAERRFAAAVAEIGAAEAERYPTLTLSGTFNLQTDTFSGLFDDSLVYSLGPQLSWPLFEGGRIDANVRVQRSQAERARIDLERRLLRAIEEVETASAGVVQTRRRVKTLEAARAAGVRAETLARQRYDAGVRDLFELIDAQRELAAIDDALVVARRRALTESILLYRALGGGWLHLPHAPADAQSASDGSTTDGENSS